jgi:hypothetical protein
MTRSDIVAAQFPDVRSTFIAILPVQAECGLLAAQYANDYAG